jgi:hypothetical protein
MHLNSNKAAAAILKVVGHFHFCDFETQHAFLSLCINIHQNRFVIAHFIAFTLNFKHGGGGHLQSGLSLPVLHFWLSTGSHEPTCQISLESDEKKLAELLQFEFFHNGGCRHLGFDDRWPLTRNLMCKF